VPVLRLNTLVAVCAAAALTQAYLLSRGRRASRARRYLQVWLEVRPRQLEMRRLVQLQHVEQRVGELRGRAMLCCVCERDVEVEGLCFDFKRAFKRHPHGWEFLFPKAKSRSLFADVLPADTLSCIQVVASADLPRHIVSRMGRISMQSSDPIEIIPRSWCF